MIKFDPEALDALPEDFHDLSWEEQTEYWKSRAEYFLDKFDRQQRAIEARRRARDQLWRELMSKVKPCPHTHTEHVWPGSVQVRGLVVDTEEGERCVECGLMVSEVSA